MGLPLLDWIFTREETTEATCAVLVKQVIQALQYLHSAHVSYLDLKVWQSTHVALFRLPVMAGHSQAQ